MKASLYFPHDYNARTDIKIARLMRKYGVAGYGVFWAILEELYKAGGRLPLNELDGLAFALHLDVNNTGTNVEQMLNNSEQMLNNIVHDFDLFQNDGEFFWSESANKRIQHRLQVSENRRKGGIASGKSRQNPENGTNVEQMLNNTGTNVDANNKYINNKNNTSFSLQENVSKPVLSQGEIQQKTDVPDEDKIDVPSKTDDVDYKRIVELFHQHCPTFARVTKLNDKRKQKIRIRFVDEMKKDWGVLESVFEKMGQSKFLQGDNQRGWKATFDWVFTNDSNWVKIHEGQYDNRTSGGKQQKTDSNINDIWQ